MIRITTIISVSTLFISFFFFSSVAISEDIMSQKKSESYWKSRKLEPRKSISVYWVGHSLIEGTSKTVEGDISLVKLMGTFARSSKLFYSDDEQTLWGTSLSAHWNGKPHNYSRDAQKMVSKREFFQEKAKKYDTLVATELLPIRFAHKKEYSSYYLQQFYCTLMNANPDARVYLYESWKGLQMPDDSDVVQVSASRFDWKETMRFERSVWNQIADEASSLQIQKPGVLSKISSFLGYKEKSCNYKTPIYIVPVGTALVALFDRLKSPKENDDFTLSNGETLSFWKLFRNPYVDWPKEWPLSEEAAKKVDEKSVITKLTLDNPKEEHDDVHMNHIGIYFVSLVHYATLYGKSPVGLPHLYSIGEKLGKTLQCIAWDVVRNDPRTGVSADTKSCDKQ